MNNIDNTVALDSDDCMELIKLIDQQKKAEADPDKRAKLDVLAIKLVNTHGRCRAKEKEIARASTEVNVSENYTMFSDFPRTFEQFMLGVQPSE